MWQHNVYYVCVTFSVVRYVGLPENANTFNVPYKSHKPTLRIALSVTRKP